MHREDSDFVSLVKRNEEEGWEYIDTLRIHSACCDHETAVNVLIEFFYFEGYSAVRATRESEGAYNIWGMV